MKKGFFVLGMIVFASTLFARVKDKDLTEGVSDVKSVENERTRRGEIIFPRLYDDLLESNISLETYIQNESYGGEITTKIIVDVLEKIASKNGVAQKLRDAVANGGSYPYIQGIVKRSIIEVINERMMRKKQKIAKVKDITEALTGEVNKIADAISGDSDFSVDSEVDTDGHIQQSINDLSDESISPYGQKHKTQKKVQGLYDSIKNLRNRIHPTPVQTVNLSFNENDPIERAEDHTVITDIEPVEDDRAERFRRRILSFLNNIIMKISDKDLAGKVISIAIDKNSFVINGSASLQKLQDWLGKEYMQGSYGKAANRLQSLTNKFVEKSIDKRSWFRRVLDRIKKTNVDYIKESVFSFIQQVVLSYGNGSENPPDIPEINVNIVTVPESASFPDFDEHTEKPVNEEEEVFLFDPYDSGFVSVPKKL